MAQSEALPRKERRPKKPPPSRRFDESKGFLFDMGAALLNIAGTAGGMSILLGRIAWREAKDQPGPVELGRPKAKDIPDDQWRLSPGKTVSLEERIGRFGRQRNEAVVEAIPAV